MKIFKKSLIIMMIIGFYPLFAFSAVQNAQSILIAITPEDPSVQIGFDLSGPGASGIVATAERNSILLRAPENGFSSDLIEMVIFANSQKACSIKFYCQSYFGKACLKDSISIENYKVEKGMNAYIIPWNENSPEVQLGLVLKKSDTDDYYCSSAQ